MQDLEDEMELSQVESDPMHDVSMVADDALANAQCVTDTFVVDFVDEKMGKMSLQDAFKKYKNERQRKIKHARKRKDVPNEVRLRAMADPNSMWKLRMKFVNQAKKYFGVPYAKRYWTPDDAEYHAPFFLDCCGLVRRVMRDLRRDFGFSMGPWNQAYQFDTLPIQLAQSDMKPGDLVFISATYYNKKSKKQKHDMTHVEMWLGDGPKTIGARWQKGKVQIFDSYKFTATSYHSETYHFRSIDTWLMGICRSHCPKHEWRTRAEKFKPGKKSIFSLQKSKSGDSAEDEAAEDSAGQESQTDLSQSVMLQSAGDTDITAGDTDTTAADRVTTAVDADTRAGDRVIATGDTYIIANNADLTADNTNTKTYNIHSMTQPDDTANITVQSDDNLHAMTQSLHDMHVMMPAVENISVMTLSDDTVVLS